MVGGGLMPRCVVRINLEKITSREIKVMSSFVKTAFSCKFNIKNEAAALISW